MYHPKKGAQGEKKNEIKIKKVGPCRNRWKNTAFAEIHVTSPWSKSRQIQGCTNLERNELQLEHGSAGCLIGELFYTPYRTSPVKSAVLV